MRPEIAFTSIAGAGMIEQSVIHAVRQQHKLSDIVRGMTRLRPCAGGFMGCCIFHKEKTPSLHISDIRGTYKCFGCGEYGDIFDLLMKIKGLTFQEAVEELSRDVVTGVSGAVMQTRESQKADASEDEKRRIAHAHGIWLKREPVAGTLAERYLAETRGVPGRLPDILGYVHRAYCSPLGEEVPALIAPLQDAGGIVTAVQQIFLCGETLDAWRDPDGRRIKRTLGVMRDGCVRLGLPDTTLGLAGSVEDALAASALFSLPVWATCGEQRFERVWVPDEIDELVIFADADAAGQRAADAGARKHWGKRNVTVHAPSNGAKDWCQIMMERAA